jgi:16S rRNA (uracil1498-N3)-methyltransferase
MDELTLGGATAAHMLKVLRIRPGTLLWIGDGAGHLRKGEVTAVGKRDLTVAYSGSLVEEEAPSPPVILAQAMLQNREDLERALVTSVEAGVDKILLFRAERSNRDLPDMGTTQGKRLKRLMCEASSQARRAWIPEIDCVDSLSEIFNQDAQLFVADPEASPETENLSGHLQSLLVLVGPEGGFSDYEETTITQQDATGIWLGPATLRARTAASLAVHRLVLAREVG